MQPIHEVTHGQNLFHQLVHNHTNHFVPVFEAVHVFLHTSGVQNHRGGPAVEQDQKVVLTVAPLRAVKHTHNRTHLPTQLFHGPREPPVTLLQSFELFNIIHHFNFVSHSEQLLIATDWKHQPRVEKHVRSGGAWKVTPVAIRNVASKRSFVIFGTRI